MYTFPVADFVTETFPAPIWTRLEVRLGRSRRSDAFTCRTGVVWPLNVSENVPVVLPVSVTRWTSFDAIPPSTPAFDTSRTPPWTWVVPR